MAGKRIRWHCAGQAIYVPIYSHIYFQGGTPYLLESTVSVRNTDSSHPITIASARYYDTHGKLVKDYADAPVLLPPLATAEYLVQRRDTSGGSGANFIIQWVAEDDVEEPLVEAVMVGTAGNHGVSFARSGRILAKSMHETQPPAK